MKGVPVRSGKDVGADHISIDEVVSSMDRTPEDYRSLYYRWETERWDTGAADLSGDRRAWSELAPDRRALFAWLLSRLRLDCETTILVSFADAVPAEEQQVFMTTQIVDEARRAVFLGRYTSEVTGDAAGNGPREALDATLRAVS